MQHPQIENLMTEVTPLKPRRKRRIFSQTFIFVLVTFAVLFCMKKEGSAKQISQWEWEGIPRVVAIGDVHGFYIKLVSLLQGTGLISSGLAWTGGEDHVVLCGDMLDRGPDERAVLDLVMRLQNEAKAAGGQVHALLGNHDVLNLVKDFRYIHPKGFADFAQDEREEDRQKAWKKYKAVFSKKGINESQLKDVFDERYPPGYFARLIAFEIEGQYGSWLLNITTIIKINSVAFVHGGLRTEVAELGIEKINSEIRESIRTYMTASKRLENLLDEPPSFSELNKIAHAVERGIFHGRSVNRGQTLAARSIVKELEALPFSPEGPLWYRGNSLRNQRIEDVPLKESLKHLGADALVVAHTPTGSGEITARFAGNVFRSDVGMAYGRKPLALVIIDQKFDVFNPADPTPGLIHNEPIAEEEWSKIMEQLPDTQMEEFLLKAEVKSVETHERQGRKFRIVVLERKGLRLRAVFLGDKERIRKMKAGQIARFRRYQHEVASYLLDRKLGLTMVPVTVARKIDGQRGALQVWLESATDMKRLKQYTEKSEEEIVEDFRGKYKQQVDQAYILAALFDVQERFDAGKMFLPEEERIMLADNTKAFSISPEIQERFHSEIRGPLSASLEYSLRSLKSNELQTLFKSLLSKNQIDALLKRCDQILDLYAGQSE